MGKQDSTKTRVKPVFDKISRKKDWLMILVDEASKANGKECFNFDDHVIEMMWGIEKSLDPPKEYLIWLAKNIQYFGFDENQVLSGVSEPTAKKRIELINGNQDTINEAVSRIIDNFKSRSKWWILEGKTHVDAFVKTNSHIFIFEGKRTEKEQTQKVEWNPKRDQLIRNIDCAISEYPNKEVVAYYVLEADEGAISRKWETGLEKYRDEEYFKASLPHRTSDEVKKIMDSYRGYITWQQISEWFGIDLI